MSIAKALADLSYEQDRLCEQRRMERERAVRELDAPPTPSDPLKPPISLLCKLGSVAVHADELLSPGGHPVDRDALLTVLRDPEVAEWLEQMRAMAMLPVKR